MSESRGLTPEFMSAIKDGLLAPVLRRVKNDHTLDMQIRNEEVHIYYRGGKILGLKPASRSMDAFNCFFDRKYFGSNPPSTEVTDLPDLVGIESDIEAWLNGLPHLKQAVDFFYTDKGEKNEREFQQVICRENNYANVSNATDYFIVDCEYVHPHFPAGRLDLVAFKWKSTGSARKKGEVRLVFIEVKYADGALTGKSGLRTHVERMLGMARDPEALSTTEQEMLGVFRQKRDLDLIRFGAGTNTNEVDSFLPGPPEILLMLINHDPEKRTLLSELNGLGEEQKAKVKIATSSFLGYGLYEECVFSHSEFIKRYSHQLHSRGQ